jgi:putative transposase
MPRSARIMLDGAAIHVVHRGNNRMPCFLSDEDRAFYLHQLGRMLPRSRCLLHAYCLMDNHVHLLLTTENAKGCAILMKSVAQLYAQYFNKAHGRTGYLWEGRFRSCLVQDEHYALACYRYIEMNPVRAAMVASARDFYWSSFRRNAHGETSPLITPHAEYEQLGRTPPERQAVYRDLFGTAAAAPLEEIRRATNGGFVLGDARFKKSVARALGRRVEARSPGRRSAGKAGDSAAGDGQMAIAGLENGVRP